MSWVPYEEHGRVFCADCGVVCIEKAEGDHPWAKYGSRHEVTLWEADHEIPLEDGGPHAVENLRCRCVPCHRRKTAREATERAECRRLGRLPAPSPDRQLALAGAA